VLKDNDLERQFFLGAKMKSLMEQLQQDVNVRGPLKIYEMFSEH